MPRQSFPQRMQYATFRRRLHGPKMDRYREFYPQQRVRAFLEQGLTCRWNQPFSIDDVVAELEHRNRLHNFPSPEQYNPKWTFLVLVKLGVLRYAKSESHDPVWQDYFDGDRRLRKNFSMEQQLQEGWLTGPPILYREYHGKGSREFEGTVVRVTGFAGLQQHLITQLAELRGGPWPALPPNSRFIIKRYGIDTRRAWKHQYIVVLQDWGVMGLANIPPRAEATVDLIRELLP